MAKRIFAKVKPEILIWARESAGFTVETATDALNIAPEVLTAWEGSGDTRPSLPQLRKLAGLYKRPLAVFYLQEAPVRFRVLSDLRRSVAGQERPYSPALTQEIRSAQQRRELALELRDDIDEPVDSLPFQIDKGDPERSGAAIRDFLEISNDQIQQFGGDQTGRLGFNTWRKAIEQAGVLVFQSTRIPQAEASGFALAYDRMPVVVVNRKDIPQRRLFSMLHEFAHVALRESGVSDLKIGDASSKAPDIEILCNAIAAAALMPKEFVLAELAKALGGSSDLSDDVIARVSRQFGVSRPALLLRLIEVRRATWNFYFEKTAQYAAEYEKETAARPPVKDMKRNIPQESLSNLGRTFVGLVLGNYYQRRLTLNDVAGYLGIRVKHVETLQRLTA